MKAAARFCDALALLPGPSCIVCLVGGGGKTTAMFRLAHELRAAGLRLLVTTTTNIFVPGPDQCDEFMLEGCADPGDLAGRARGTITCLGNGIIGFVEMMKHHGDDGTVHLAVAKGQVFQLPQPQIRLMGVLRKAFSGLIKHLGRTVNTDHF